MYRILQLCFCSYMPTRWPRQNMTNHSCQETAKLTEETNNCSTMQSNAATTGIFACRPNPTLYSIHAQYLHHTQRHAQRLQSGTTCEINMVLRIRILSLTLYIKHANIYLNKKSTQIKQNKHSTHSHQRS
jgi:hypothetical protein